ncbi:MAG: ComEC/Rec2 family competence protein [Bacilli bacterium]|jgi:competence protein ComEC|nr:ComEC/Rec2 family competence protein [Bacilli bacterium]
MILFLLFASFASSLAFFGFNYSFYPLLIFLLILAFAFFKGWKKAVLCLLVFLLGGLVFLLVPKKMPQSGTISGLVIKAESNYFLLRTFQGVFYVSYKNNPFEVGDIIQGKANYQELTFGHYEGSFDFKSYLKSQGAFFQMSLSAPTFLFKTFLRVNSWKENLLSNYSSASASLLSSLVFFDSMRKVNGYYGIKNLGIIHLFSSSGIHLALLSQAMRKIMERKAGKRITSLSILLAITLISFISGFTPSLERVFLMFLLSFLSSFEKLPSFSYGERLSLTGLLVLLHRPLYILDIGFYFTYPLLFLFFFIRGIFGKRERWMRIKMLLSFGLLVLPLNMFLSYGVSPISLIMQFLLSPLLSFLYLVDLTIFLGKLSVPFLEKINNLVVNILPIFSKVDFIIECGKINVGTVLVFYVGILLIILLKELTFRKEAKIISFVMLGMLVFCFLPDFQTHAEVIFLDVGQGDSTLIRSGRENILIDTGGNTSMDLAQECLIPFFRKEKIYSLDLVLTTHDDFDHVGALSSLNQNFSIKRIVKGGEEKEVVIGGLKISDLNEYRYEGEESNYGSAVYSFPLKKTSFLIMGDAPKAIEERIIADHPSLHSDILKVGHHGSDTSSSKVFLQTLKPMLAVISCGYHNLYGHPSKSTIANLEDLRIPYIRTDQTGSFIYRV